MLVLAAGLFMAVLTPFGTASIPFARGLAYWIGTLGAGTLLANLIARHAVRMGLYERQPWVWAVLVSIVLTLPMTAVVWAASGLTFRGRLDPATLSGYALPVLIITLAMVTLTVLVQRTPAQTHAAAPGAPAPVFLERLPMKLRGGELYAVEAEDHYLRLHTSRGQDLILMRLADAVGELDGMEGARVHRSWWVARAAVVETERGAGRAALTLKSGAVAPVSRTYARALREAGWY